MLDCEGPPYEEILNSGQKQIQQKKKAYNIFKKINAHAVYKLDVRKKKNISLVFSKIKKKFGKIDVLVNNAGVNKTADFDKLKEEDFKENVQYGE